MALRKEYIQSELLVIQHLRGNKRAFEELVHVWEKPLFYYIRRLVDTEEDAWDAMQDVWLKVSRELRRLRDPAAFPAWLYRLAHNSTIDHLRKNPPFRPLPEGDSESDKPANEAAALWLALDAEELHWGLTQLTNHHRETLILHFLEGFSLDEISDITGVPVGTVKSRVYYAKKALREVLKKEASHHE